jgi:hypothetical protein
MAKYVVSGKLLLWNTIPAVVWTYRKHDHGQAVCGLAFEHGTAQEQKELLASGLEGSVITVMI